MAVERSHDDEVVELHPAPDQPSLPLNVLRARLEHFATLRQDWDSYGADPISPTAIRAARTLLDSLAMSDGESARPYAIAPLATGGLQIEWRGAGGEIEVEVEPDGQLSLLVVERSDERISCHEADAVGPATIEAWLTRLYRHGE